MSPAPQPARRALNVLAGPMLRSQPDERIVELFREGHGRAFDEIDRRYRIRLRAYAASFVGESSADDVIQDAFSRAARSLSSNENEINLRPWLYRIVRNTSLNALRDAPPSTSELDELQTGSGGEPSDVFEQREELADVLAAMQKLPVNQRQAIVLRELEGMGHADIAAEIETSEGSVRQLIYRARTSLREAMGAVVPFSFLRAALTTGGAATPVVAGGVGAAGLSGASSAGGGLIVGGTFAKAAATVLVAGAAVGGGVAVERATIAKPDSPAPVVIREAANTKPTQDTAAPGTSQGGKALAQASAFAADTEDSSGHTGPGASHNGAATSGGDDSQQSEISSEGASDSLGTGTGSGDELDNFAPPQSPNSGPGGGFDHQTAGGGGDHSGPGNGGQTQPSGGPIGGSSGPGSGSGGGGQASGGGTGSGGPGPGHGGGGGSGGGPGPSGNLSPSTPPVAAAPLPPQGGFSGGKGPSGGSGSGSGSGPGSGTGAGDGSGDFSPVVHDGSGSSLLG